MAQTALKIEPKGEWLSESEIAKRVKLHRQTVVSRLEDLGREPDTERSHAKLKVYWFDDELQFAILNAKDKYAAVKYRDTKAAAELKELKLSKERGELVPMHEAVELIRSIVGKIFQELTVSQGKRIDPKLVKARTLIEVKKIRNGDNQRIMKMLRANFTEFIGK